MKLSEMKSLDQVVEEHRQDPEFREEWDRLAFAREVANRIVAYRTGQSLKAHPRHRASLQVRGIRRRHRTCPRLIHAIAA